MLTKVRSYSVIDDYNGIGANAPTPKEISALRKIALLRDFDILKRKDCREDAVYNMLMKCRDEHHMSQMLHDVLREIITLDELLERKGYVQ